jgi:hypothetical protein
MKRLLGVAFWLVLLVAPVLAQSGAGPGLYWQCKSTTSSGNVEYGYCPVNTTYPLPVTTSSSGSSTANQGTAAAASAAWPVYLGGYSYSNITTDTTTTVKSGAGTLHAVCINTLAATETVKLYDNTAGSGTLIGTITEATGQSPGCLAYDVSFSTGLTVVTATAAGDLTISWR